MNHSIYNIVEIAKSCASVAQNDLGKKKFQKLVYLIENIGKVNLGYTYSIYFYGPYSAVLDDELRTLSAAGYIRYDVTEYAHLMRVAQSREVSVDFSEEDTRRIDAIVGKYGSWSPRDLELLTTAHYVASVLGKDASLADIKSGVIKLKGKKYLSSEIDETIKSLSSL